MTTAVLPYPLGATDAGITRMVSMPVGAVVFTCGSRARNGYAGDRTEVLDVFAKVDLDAAEEVRQFCLFATGEPIPDWADERIHYVATVTTRGATWHVFEYRL